MLAGRQATLLIWPGLRFVPEASREDFVENFQWRAELDMYQSEIVAVLPEGMRTPALHHVVCPDADHIALRGAVPLLCATLYGAIRQWLRRCSARQTQICPESCERSRPRAAAT
jgi:hypothetical protein